MVNAIQSTTTAYTSPFVVKFNSTGTGLVYSTYFGGGGGGQGYGIALDSGGNVYVTGSTWATDFPTTAGVFQPTKPGSAGFTSAFVFKIAP